MRARLAVASLRRHATRTTLTTLGVAVATAMLLDMVMLSGGMRESFRRLLLSRGFQLRLSPKGTLPFDTDATITGASEIERILRTNPAVGVVSPVLGAPVHVARAGRVVTSVALGVDPARQGDYQLLAGRDATAPGTAVVNAEFLAATGAEVGDTLEAAGGYDAATRSFAGERKLVVTGRARFLYTPAGRPAAALPLTTLQSMGGPASADRVSLFMVAARPGADVEQLRRWIEANVPRVTALSIRTALAQLDERLSYFRQLAFILGTVSLLVGFLLVTTLMTVSVNERVGEISVMRAIGVSAPHVVQQVVLEGVILNAVGAVLGTAAGVATAKYLNAILSDFPGFPTAIDFFLFQPRAVWVALGLLMVVGVLAGVYPAWRAASLPIAATLRQEAVA